MRESPSHHSQQPGVDGRPSDVGSVPAVAIACRQSRYNHSHVSDITNGSKATYLALLSPSVVASFVLVRADMLKVTAILLITPADI